MAKVTAFIKMGLDIILAISAGNWKLCVMFSGFVVADFAAAMMV